MKKKIKYKDGSEYLGSLNANKKKHGKGKLIYNNGEEFIGEWKLDKKDGFGIYHDKDKKIIRRGFWEKGIFLTKSEYFAKKNKQQLRSKYKQLYDEYIQQKNQALDGYGEDPDKHPFVDAPEELMDDKEFLLSLLENDEYSQDLDFLEFTSERLLADKEFVTKVFSCEYYGDEYKNHISQKLRTDIDIINLVGFKIFKEFGHEILNSKTKLLKIIRNSQSKQFYDWEAIPDKIRSDKDFFLSLSTIPNCSHTIKWASKNIQKDPKIILSYLKTAAEAIKYISGKVKNYNKLVENALSRKGSLILELNTKFKKNKHFVRIASKTYPEVLRKINKDLKKDKKIVINCLNQKPELIEFVDNKFKADKKIVLNYLYKKPSILKHVHKKFKQDKKIFLFFVKKYFKKIADTTSNDDSPLKYFDKKIIFNPNIITLLIDKRGKEASYVSLDAVTSNVCNYVNKTKNFKILKYALNKSPYYFSGLNEKIRENKEITLDMVKHGNEHIYQYISKNLKKDPDVLEAAEKKFSEGFINFKTKKKEYKDIKDVDRHNNLYWDLYWYIFYKKNPDKITNETEHVSSVRIKSFDGLFDDYEDMYYSGEMMNGRPHGHGYASNEESENHGDYIYIKTYEGEWKDGLPHGKGEHKEYEEGNYPPDGEIQYNFKGEFIEGKKISDEKNN